MTITKEDLEEYNSLARSVFDSMLEGTVVVTLPQSRAFIKDFEKRKLEDEDSFSFGTNLQDHLFWSRMTPEEFSKNLFQAKKLLISKEVPAALKSLVQEARLCLASGLYTAVASLSRTIFEAAVIDVVVSLRRLPNPEENPNFYKEYPHHLRLSHIFSKGDPSIIKMQNFYREACAYVHGSKLASFSDAKRLLESSFDYVEMVYARLPIQNSKP